MKSSARGIYLSEEIIVCCYKILIFIIIFSVRGNIDVQRSKKVQQFILLVY